MGGSYGRRQAGAQVGYPGRQSGRPTSTPTPPTTTAGATSRRPRSCAASMPTSARATTRPNSTSPSPAPTTSSARSRRPRSRCSRSAGRASTRGRRPPISSSPSSPRAPTTRRPTRSRSRATPIIRGYWQAHVDGNGTDAQPCDPARRAGRPALHRRRRHADQHELPGPQHDLAASASSARSTATGPRPTASAAPSRRRARAKFLGHDNHFVDGHERRSRPHQVHRDAASSAPSTRTCSCTGPASTSTSRRADITPVSLFAKNTYTGVYATDTLDVTSTSSRSPPARGSTSPRSTCSTRPAPIPCSTAQPLPAHQSGDRRDLQVHAEPHRLCRLFRGEPRADAAGARLLEPDQPLHHRQLPDRRSAAQAGGLAHLRGRAARHASAPMSQTGVVELVGRHRSTPGCATTSSTSPARSR